MSLDDAILEMHHRCAVFTTENMACRILDWVGWTASVDLRESVLLEPCVGDGSILVEAARRLISSLQDQTHRLGEKQLRERIRGFEFHPETALKARARLEQVLIDEGLDLRQAKLLPKYWVAGQDFLLQAPEKATHVAANPPYLRWGKVPDNLANIYRPTVGSFASTGDISLAFLDRMQQWLTPNGKIVALLSDRWMFAQYGEAFLDHCKGEGWRLEVLDECTTSPFVQSVGVSAVVVRFSRARFETVWRCHSRRTYARTLRERLVRRHGTLRHAGCDVRVGPALGCGGAFVVGPDCTVHIEAQLLRDYIDRKRLKAKLPSKHKLQVITPFDAEGKVISLDDYPLFKAWAEGQKERLSNRSQAKRGMEWWRTIDVIGTNWNRTPKLLLPELVADPQVTIDYSNSIPAHSIYAVWPGTWPAPVLAKVLNAGILRLEAEAEAPILKRKWYRLYKRFIDRVPLPRWEGLSEKERLELSSMSARTFSNRFKELFEFEPVRNQADAGSLVEKM